MINLIIKKIFVYVNEICSLPSTDPSIIDRQRIGWIFYFLNQSSIKLDHCSIFIQLIRILQPWFSQSLSQFVTQMTDDQQGTGKALISEEKSERLLRTITMFANPMVDEDENDQMTIMPRNQLNKAELMMFKKRKEIIERLDRSICGNLGEILAEVPVGLLNEEDEQNLEMNIDLSKTDRNCTKQDFYPTIFSLFDCCSPWLCSSTKTDESITIQTKTC